MRNLGLKGLITTAVLAAVLPTAHAGLTELSIGYYTDYSFGMSVQGSSQTSVSSAFAASRVGGDPLPASHPDPFVTFCLDIDSTLANGWWKSGTFSDVTLTADSGKIRQADGLYFAAQLYQTYSSGIMAAGGSFINKVAGSALQLAIWEVLYETTAGAFNLTAGSGFSVSSGDSSVKTLAQTMLDSLKDGSGNRIAANYSLDTMFWNASTSGGYPRSSQDLIGPFTPVPEPSTYIAGALIGIPVLINGLRYWRRRNLSR